MLETVALIVAAGRGSRFGEGMPKQYRMLGGTPVLRRTVSVFLAHPRVDQVRIVIHADDYAQYEECLAGLDLLPPVHGGATRQESVFLGLESLSELKPERVLIHDAARPAVDAGLIDRVLNALAEAPAALPAVPVVDTLKKAAADRPHQVAGTIDRAGLWRAQTPQGFHYDAILTAHRSTQGKNFTDDAAIAEHVGLAVTLVAGSEDNVKITTEDDLRRQERMIGSMSETRTGLGFDVHRFSEGDHVMLGGVAIPHSAGLEGHSDADVALHALTDALLGAIGAGDIGTHFPPTDTQWRGAPSHRFLEHAASLIRDWGGAVVHVDLTVICERPKVGPHRAAIQQRIAAILAIEPDRVSIKATTTERLGFTGRQEGIAAQAVATVCRR
jgi:2-C-methyl-D-erythritol 2,4-cyclodiphosphate synthase/2-C-methyl-D-erythritol 4-phosphate cytidylyltransferase